MICDCCLREMTAADGRSADRLSYIPYVQVGPVFDQTQRRPDKEVIYDRIRWGAEKPVPGLSPEIDAALRRDRCGDCGAKPGHFHHPNCDLEECPICHHQILGCGCDTEGAFADLQPGKS